MNEMNVWEMAQKAVSYTTKKTTINKGRKPTEYTELRGELVNCCGREWARQLIREAFADREATC